MTRAEHLSWAKQRALRHVMEGKLSEAINSMGSDLGQHDELKGKHVGDMLVFGHLVAKRHGPRAVAAWIEGFE